MRDKSVLIVEDDRELAKMVQEFLQEHELGADIESDGLRACSRILEADYDAVILDIGLPSLDGIEVCRKVRTSYSGTIIMLTARGEEIDEVVALEVGADDYMAKPVRPRALLARLKAHLKRGPKSTETESGDTARRIGTLLVDPSRREVSLSERDIDLTTAEFDLLLMLADRVGSVVPRAEIYAELNGFRYDGLDRSIDLRVSRLRKKLGDAPQDPQIIKSVRGVGYILVPPK